MSKVTQQFLKRRYLEVLNNECFLVQLIEVLERIGDHEEAALVRKEKDLLKVQRLELKKALEKQKRHVG